ncbi:MAG: matrixin family metalloprotease [Candidatus Limnocylindrales bacterium]
MRIAFLVSAVLVALAAAPASAAASSVHGDGASAATPEATAGRSYVRTACGDSAYKFLGPAAGWKQPLRWAFRASSTPAGLSSSAVLAVIKKSFRNVTTSRNDCGIADTVSATSSYLGSTTRKPGVSSSGSCLGQDGYNVVGFGSLGGYYSGYTCIYWEGDEIVEMDMRLDTGTHWALSLSGCRDELVMEALVTHEAGHAFGLGHVSETKHGRQTMSVYIDGLCENQEATLGRGDVLGLQALY